MSEIPFVNRLGDAIETATAQPERAKRRRRRRRFGGLAVAILLLGAGGVTVAEILDDPEKLATGPVACYDRASLDANAYVQSAEGRSPTELCAGLLRTSAPLAPCVKGEGVFVFPGPPETCERLGLKPLPAGYDAARLKVARLRAAVDRVIRRADCIPPAELARRLQRILDRHGWRGWRAVVGGPKGPCGWVGVPIGMRAERRELGVYGGPPRSLDRFLSGPGGGLMVESSQRCYTVRGLSRLVRRRLAPAGRPLRIVVEVGPLPDHQQFEPPARQRRFEQGCAVADDVYAVFPRPGRIVIRAEIQVLER